jgi:broad specificity phosphatase PhoE
MNSDLEGYDIPHGPVRITLVRHGEAPWTTDGRTIDEPSLSSRGIEQCRALATALASFSFDMVAVSPQVRAQQTALIILGEHTRAQTEDWLAEIRYPSWQGQPPEVAARALAELRTLPMEQRWQAFEDSGEGVRAFLARVRSGLVEFLDRLRISLVTEPEVGLWEVGPLPRHLLMIGHAGSINAIMSVLLGLPSVPWEWERFQVGHASISHLVTIPVGARFSFSVERLSDLEHLPGHLRSW